MENIKRELESAKLFIDMQKEEIARQIRRRKLAFKIGFIAGVLFACLVIGVSLNL